MRHYDVVIIGAGLAGLHCARLLAKPGLQVLLVDRKPLLTQSIHTTGIFVRRTLTDFNIPEQYLGPPIRDVTMYSPSRRSLTLTSPHDEFRIGRMGPLYQAMLEQCVRAGVEWMPETRYADHRFSRDKAFVQLDVKSGSRQVITRYLVGADGVSSNVAKNLRLDVNRHWIVGVEEVLSNVPLNGPPRLDCFIDPELAPGYIAWIAHDGEEAHIGVGGYPKLFDPISALEKFRSSLEGIIDLSRSKRIERRGGRIPVGGVLSRIASREGLLIGDAAGAVSPLTAGGLDPCMRLSTFAAKVIPEYLESRNPEVLTLYSGDLFRARFTSRLWMRRLFAGIRQPVLAELACVSLRLPVFRLLACHVFFGRGSFPDPPTLVTSPVVPSVAST